MKNAVFIVSALLMGLLLSGCISSGGDHNAINYTNDTSDNNAAITNVTSDFRFTVPSELPTAHVGKPFFYSFCDPQSEATGDFESGCGQNPGSVNPKGGAAPYDVTVRQWTADPSRSADWFVMGLYSEKGMLNLTPTTKDVGQYLLEVCASDRSDPVDRICENTTLYIMSDVANVKGDGILTHDLLLKLNSIVVARDFAGHEDSKDVKTGYMPTSNFSFEKVTSTIPTPSGCASSAWCGAGSSSGLDVAATDTVISITADGGAACGKESFPGGYNVDYYMVGYVGYADNAYIALDITNTGTKEKAVDIYLNVSSEVGAGSQNYFDAAAASQLCIGTEHCVTAPTGKPGAIMANGTVYRVIVRPGHHRISVGAMDNNLVNTNMVKCPSSVSSNSKASLVIIPADANDGKTAIGRIYTRNDGTSDFMEMGFS
ncbi:Uncharacterised protein [uncultured archaeon]|nr:Uncharacterised protein [uncultured archaeon]